jgi:hypothetical protein
MHHYVPLRKGGGSVSLHMQLHIPIKVALCLLVVRRGVSPGAALSGLSCKLSGHGQGQELACPLPAATSVTQGHWVSGELGSLQIHGATSPSMPR